MKKGAATAGVGGGADWKVENPQQAGTVPAYEFCACSKLSRLSVVLADSFKVKFRPLTLDKPKVRRPRLFLGLQYAFATAGASAPGQCADVGLHARVPRQRRRPRDLRVCLLD